MNKKNRSSCYLSIRDWPEAESVHKVIDTKQWLSMVMLSIRVCVADINNETVTLHISSYFCVLSLINKMVINSRDHSSYIIFLRNMCRCLCYVTRYNITGICASLLLFFFLTHYVNKIFCLSLISCCCIFVLLSFAFLMHTHTTFCINLLILPIILIGNVHLSFMDTGE